MATTEVERDRVDPGMEPGAHSKVSEACVGLKESVLRQVLRIRGVARHSVGEIEDGARVLVDEMAKGSLVTGEDVPDRLQVLRLCGRGIRHEGSFTKTTRQCKSMGANEVSVPPPSTGQASRELGPPGPSSAKGPS